MLSFVGMEDKADIYPAKLSGGETTSSYRTALIREPKILLCDEPTSALDEDTKADVLALLQKFNRRFSQQSFSLVMSQPQSDKFVNVCLYWKMRLCGGICQSSAANCPQRKLLFGQSGEEFVA